MTTAAMIRDATLDDVEAICAIYNHAVLHTTATADVVPHSFETRAAWLEAHRADDLAVLVAERDGAVVGWGSLSYYHARPGYRFTVEDSIYIAPSHQRAGIGSALLARLIEAAGGRGARSMVAAIADLPGGNSASIPLHERFGFVTRGRIVEAITKFDRWIDVVYMQRRL